MEQSKKIVLPEHGFTLIEVLAAMVILGIGLLGCWSMQDASIKGNSRANNLLLASTWCSSELERISGLPYDDTLLDDSDGDGSGHDLNIDGVDDAGEFFGLDDVTKATADATITSFDSKYTIFINVAIDIPTPGLKTVYVHVQDNRKILATPVAFKYFKYHS